MRQTEETPSRGSSKLSSSQEKAVSSDMEAFKSGCVFPFFDELTQRIDLPYALYVIVLLWIILQNILTSLWLAGNSVVAAYRPLARICRGIFMAATFTSLGATSDALLPVLVFCATFFVVTVGIVAALLASFMSKRRFLTPGLYIARILIELVPIILLFPVASACGQSLSAALSGGGSSGYVYFGIGVVVLIGYLAIFNITFSFLGNSPFLTRSPFAFFDPTAYRHHVIASSLFFVFSLGRFYFPEWFIWALTVAHFLYSAVALARFLFRPFIEHWLNVAMAAACFYTAVMDIVMLISGIFAINSGVAILVLIFLLIPVSIAVARAADSVISKRIDRNAEALDHEELCASPRMAVFYLDYAIAHRRMRLCDGTFAKCIADTYNDGPLVCHCARVMSWLPFNGRPFSFLCRRALDRRDLGLGGLFVVFQLEHIRLLRESSSSPRAVKNLRSISAIVSDTVHEMRSFWECPECGFWHLYHISSKLATADALCHEAITDFPNSMPFRDIYVTYLIEAATRYSSAIFQKSRLQMIENGFNFRIDACFRRFVRKFPEYLKLGVVSTKGHLLEHTATSQSSATTTASGGSDVLDAAVENGIGNQIMRDAQVRLTVERAFEDRRASGFGIVVAATLFSAVAAFVSYVIVLVYFQRYFDPRAGISRRVSFLNHARMNFFGGLLSWLYFWGTNTSTMRYTDIAQPLIAADKKAGWEEHWVTPELQWNAQAIRFNIKSRDYYQNFTESVVQMAQDGEDLTKYVGPLFDSDSLGVIFCTPDGVPVSEFRGNFRTVFSFMFMKESMMESTRDPRTWFSESEEMCMLMSSVFHLLPDAITAMRESVSAMGDDMAAESSRMLKPLKIALPIGLFVITAAVLQVACCLYQREINQFGALLLSLPKQDKRECTKPIRRDRDLEVASASGQSVPAKSANLPLIFNIAIILDMAACGGVLFACLENLDWYNDRFLYMNHWVLRATGRKAQVVEGTLATLLTVLIQNTMTNNFRGAKFNYLQADRLVKRIQDVVDMIVSQNKELLEGNGDQPGTIGQNANIDRLTLEQQCETDESEHSYHESYRCSGGLQLVHFFLTLILKVELDADVWGGVVWTGELAEMIHLVEAHLLPMMMEIDALYITMADRIEGQFVSSHETYFIVLIVIEFLALLIIVAYCWVMNSCYDVLLALMRKVSPAHILASDDLQAYLLNRAASKVREGLGADERIIQNSADGIVCMGPTGLIDMINPAVTSILGYQPDQLLGQPLASLLVPAQTDKLSQQISLMAEHQSAPLFEGHVTCCTDDEQEVQCGISLIAMFDGDEPSAFVAILTNESQLIKQQTEAEALKKQSETLLFQILPRAIVVRLNAGEKDISFSIPTATICFIDIVKFSEYSSNLTPPEIMGNLSLIFTNFDEELAKYPQLIKIKLIGDVYMGAGGVFTPEAAPETHAKEMIQFTLEALKIIEDVNVKLNSLLSVRIGVNTGGPILAGVLGTDKPAFDIIGDPINIAARLQSTDIPGHVQVSEDTHKLISEMPVTIEYRGEIELKGKGKKKTFLVSAAPEAGMMSITGTTPSTLEDFVRFVPESALA